ncbi:uncharacterized protein EV420DRAFT_1484940 [Desarmillaria tabescens]|uniref:Uncharacterized protein n=1 Tax=Armillaria tabescens TaxID=1929756 RepID=A0AA39JJ42_ARMTA|nr:uncharacterized protein EV420DRAFT_1484940 [Desarmillaria tabescens]KAK0443414.1 hypothetical protein EV420DRAFT_1484940 [Desarmillaria tabescens]
MHFLAHIRSWAQLKNPSNKNESKKYKNMHRRMKTAKKDVEKKPKDCQHTSTSSFEAGTLTASPEVTQTLRYNKKRSILGLRLPSSMRMKLPVARDGSTASSMMLQALSPVVVMERPSLAMSMASSLCPDEAGLEMIRDLRDRERGIQKGIKEEQKRRDSRESRRSSEGRKKTALSDIFSEIGLRCWWLYLFIELVQRLASEQLLGKVRPQGIYEDSKNSMCFINTLDLEATLGGTPDPLLIARRNTREPEIRWLEGRLRHDYTSGDDRDFSNSSYNSIPHPKCHLPQKRAAFCTNWWTPPPPSLTTPLIPAIHLPRPIPSMPALWPSLNDFLVLWDKYRSEEDGDSKDVVKSWSHSKKEFTAPVLEHFETLHNDIYGKDALMSDSKAVLFHVQNAQWAYHLNMSFQEAWGLEAPHQSNKADGIKEKDYENVLCQQVNELAICTSNEGLHKGAPEAPRIMKKWVDLINFPRTGSFNHYDGFGSSIDNCWPASQMNMASACRGEVNCNFEETVEKASLMGKGLKKDIGKYRENHGDSGDHTAVPTAMTTFTCPHPNVPEECFCLTEFGIVWVLEEFSTLYFSGLHMHGRGLAQYGPLHTDDSIYTRCEDNEREIRMMSDKEDKG